MSSLVQVLGPGPWTRQQLLGAGWGSKQVDRAVHAAALIRIRRGLFALPATPGTSVGDDAARLLRATLDRLDPRAALSHETAASLRLLWVPWPGRSGTQVTIAGQAERTDGGLTIHGSRLPEQHVELVDGMRVTTVARTAIDLARGRTLPDALVALDGAARFLLGAADPDVAADIRRRRLPQAEYDDVRRVLEAAFVDVWSWPGTRVLRQGLDLLDPASESPLESWSRGCLALAELPLPLVNWPVRGASGRTYYGDFVWKSHELIGEADGLEKYGVSPDEQRRRLRDQRRRQDDLEAAGWRVVRWVSGEPAATVTQRVQRALRPAEPARGPRLVGE